MAQETTQLHAFFRREDGASELVQEVVRRGAQSVPPAFVLPPLYRPRLSQPSHSLRPPLIDLAALHGGAAGRANCIAHIRSACEEWGFMQVVNHGASEGVMQEMWAAAERFFALPAQQRLRFYEADPRNPRQVECNATLGWRETLRFRGIWDPADHLPSFCRDPVERYQAEMTKLALRLNAIMMESLGMSGTSAQTMASTIAKKGVSLHLYPPCPDPTLALGLSTHHDITTFTILLETQHVGGLQLLHNDQWVNNMPTKGCLSIILGDQMKRLSNGRYHSVKHRVVTQSSKTRMSIATFFLPPINMKIHPLPHLIDPFHPPLFQDLSIADTLPFATNWFN